MYNSLIQSLDEVSINSKIEYSAQKINAIINIQVQKNDHKTLQIILFKSLIVI